jgi:hypothetical protein
VTIAIEVTQDLSKLMLEDVGGRFRAAEDRAVEDDALPPPRVDGKLLLTEEQWKEKTRQCSDAGHVISVTTMGASTTVQEIATSQRSGQI